jgi:hypothetical protein
MRSLRAAGAVGVALAFATCVFAATAVAAPTPASYRTGLNTMCRKSTVAIAKLTVELKRAAQAKDWHTFGFVTGQMLAIGLREDATIEATPIPAQLRPQMVPAIRILKKADATVREAVRMFVAGNAAGGLAELKKVQPLSGPINRYLDAAGLRDCGSNQA